VNWLGLDVPPELPSDCGAVLRVNDFVDEEAAGDDQMQEDPDVVDVPLASEAEAPEQPTPFGVPPSVCPT